MLRMKTSKKEAIVRKKKFKHTEPPSFFGIFIYTSEGSENIVPSGIFCKKAN